MQIYHSENTCLRISNLGVNFDGLYKPYSATLYVHTDSKKNVVLKYGWGNGWHGCQGNFTIVDSKCYPYRRWAYIHDLSRPIIGNVNIWSKRGDSSGYISCGKYNIQCIILGIPNRIILYHH